jgi:NTE family protein
VGLCLSSGFFGFFAHLGFVRALRALGVRPAALAGCSAGALVGAMVATGMEEGAIRERLLAIRPRDLLDPPRPTDLLRRPLGVIRGEKIERDLEATLPVRTFEACEVPLAVTVFDLAERRLRALDRGPIAPAVRASMSMPGLFCPAPVDGHPCWDGGIVEKAPMAPLAARDDLDAIVVCYLGRPGSAGAPRSLLAGIRAALDSHIVAAGRRDASDARARGLEVLVVAPRVPRCGPHRLHLGPSIIAASEAETRRIVESGAFGCGELA